MEDNFILESLKKIEKFNPKIKINDFYSTNKSSYKQSKRNFYLQDKLSNFITQHGYEIGDFSYGTVDIRFPKTASLKIGKFCSIARATIVLGGNHRTDWITTYPFNAIKVDFPEATTISGHPATKGDVIIGNDVWVGGDVTILSGVEIGDGAVIGRGSVVAKSIPPYCICVGNPGKPIKLRFTPKIIAFLLALQWWNWPIERIVTNIHLLQSNNFDEFFAKNLSVQSYEYYLSCSDSLEDVESVIN